VVSIETKERERIAYDLHEIVRQVLCTKRPEDMPESDEARWRFTWLMNCIWGYCQTDLGVWHPSGEDCSPWRKDAARYFDLSLVNGRHPDEQERDREQRRLYAEAMAPRVAQRMLEVMRQPESEADR
jgi:hypothetical protein